MKLAFRYIAPSVIWTILIIYLSTMPASSLDNFSLIEVIQVDKIAHIIIYAIYSLVLLYGMSYGHPSSINQNQWIIAWILGIMLGISMEVIQSSFFPDRHFDFLDIIANIIGSTAGLAVFKFFKQSSIWKYL